jgi:cell shape-determining protein MreC
VANEKTLRKIYLAETDGEQISPNDLQLQLRCAKTDHQKLLEKSQQLENQNKQLKEEFKVPVFKYIIKHF